MKVWENVFAIGLLKSRSLSGKCILASSERKAISHMQDSFSFTSIWFPFYYTLQTGQVVKHEPVLCTLLTSKFRIHANFDLNNFQTPAATWSTNMQSYCIVHLYSGLCRNPLYNRFTHLFILFYVLLNPSHM